MEEDDQNNNEEDAGESRDTSEDSKASVQEIEDKLDQVIRMMGSYSIHAEFPESVIQKVQTIAKRITQEDKQEKQHKEQEDSTKKTLSDIAQSIAAIHRRIDIIENNRNKSAGTTQGSETLTSERQDPDSNKPTNNYATSAPIKPTGTGRGSTAAQKKIPINPLAAHHLSRLILEITDGPQEEERVNSILAVKLINDRLQRNPNTENLRIVNVKWNAHNNCVISLKADQRAVTLIPHIDNIADIVTGGRNYTARADRPWYKIQLNGVWTASSERERYNIDNQFTPPTAEELHQELCDNNPDYAKMEILQKPRWMKPAQELANKVYSSLVFAVANEEDANLIVRKLKYLAIAGKYAEAKKYADKPPITQCNRCWAFGHHRIQCKAETPKCRKCAGTHTENDHRCPQCGTTDGTDTIMEEEGCAHPPRCANCQGAHFANDYTCPERVRTVGTPKAKPSRPQGTQRTAAKNKDMQPSQGNEKNDNHTEPKLTIKVPSQQQRKKMAQAQVEAEAEELRQLSSQTGNWANSNSYAALTIIDTEEAFKELDIRFPKISRNMKNLMWEENNRDLEAMCQCLAQYQDFQEIMTRAATQPSQSQEV